MKKRTFGILFFLLSLWTYCFLTYAADLNGEVGGGGESQDNIIVEPFSSGKLRVTQQAIRTIDNSYLMDDYGFRLYDGSVSVDLTYSSSMQPHYVVNANGIRQARVRTTNANRRCSGGEWMDVVYHNAAFFHGDPVDIRVHAIAGNSTSVPDTSNADINTSEFRLSTTNGTADFCDGISYYSIARVHVYYEFFYAGTNTHIPLKQCYFSFGSLNKDEGVRPTNYVSVDYFKQFGAYPNLCNVSASDTFGYGNYWGSGTWLMNQTSNDFEDHVGKPTFWKSVGSMDLRISGYKWEFDCYAPHFWFAPSMGTVGATAPEPEKVIKADSGAVLEIVKHSGDTVVFGVRQSVEEYGYFGSGFLKYSNFTLTDILPEGLIYQSARMLKNDGSSVVDVTRYGMVTYDAVSRTVGFVFLPSYLSSGMSYAGETYEFEITAKVAETSSSRTMVNRAYTTICNTRQDTDPVFVKQVFYPIATYVRWRNSDGSWTDYQVADFCNAEFHDAYHYTWVRNALRSEPENVYYNGNPVTVGTDSVTESENYYIDVERKKYTYTFKPNPPVGYAAVGISNMQPDLTDKWAETVSGSVKSPTLTGYTFLGWNTASDGGGSWYTSESMLSNKTFYAIWRKNKYQVHYDPNGSQNPDHLPGEFIQNTVLGSMADSQYEYDTKGSFRTNAFMRAGYEFIGWNTKADGSGAAYGESPYDLSGKYYSDGYANVHNMTATDGKVLTVYAQWRRKLGTDRLTVVSEETGDPVANVGVKLQKNVNGSWTDVVSKVTDANGMVFLGDLHWYNYRWVCTSVPDGYQKLSDVGFTIKHDHLEQADVRTLYMKRVILVLRSTVDAIISGESVPSFAYQVSGTDAAGVRHEYMMNVVVDRASLKGDSKALSLYAGNYDVTQVPVSRYVPGGAVNVIGGQVSGINGKAFLLTNDRCELRFPYMIDQYGGLGSMDQEENEFRTHTVMVEGR